MELQPLEELNCVNETLNNFIIKFLSEYATVPLNRIVHRTHKYSKTQDPVALMPIGLQLSLCFIYSSMRMRSIEIKTCNYFVRSNLHLGNFFPPCLF